MVVVLESFFGLSAWNLLLHTLSSVVVLWRTQSSRVLQGYHLDQLSFCSENIWCITDLLPWSFLQWLVEFHLHSSDHPFLIKFCLPPPEVWGVAWPGGTLKNLKRDISMIQGQVLLKGRGLALFLFNFSYLRFIIFTCKNYFTLCKIVLCIWKKNFFCHYNFMKKSHSKLSKNDPENIP